MASPTPRSDTASPASRRATWSADLLGALNATAAMLPFVLSYGFVAFAGLGPAGAQVGLTAAMIAVVLGGLVMAALGRSRLPAGSPSVSLCLVFGGGVTALARDPALAASTPSGLALVLGAAALVVVVAGLLMLLLGLVRAGSLVRFVPQPVLAGLMNGVAVLIVVSQLPALLGVPPDALARLGWRALAGWQGPAIAVAGATVALMVLAGRAHARAPAPLLAMAGAGLAVWAWQHAVAAPGALATLPPIGPLAVAWPRLDGLAPLADGAAWSALVPHLPQLAVTTLLVALIGALETVLNLAAVQLELGEPADPNRELMAAGVAGMASGALGGLPIVYLRTRALATRMGGGDGPRSIVAGCLLLGLDATLGLPLLEPLARAVVAGVVVVLALRLVDQETHGLLARWRTGEHRPELRTSLGIVAGVAVVTVAWGVALGVVLGVIVSVVLFIRTLHRQLVRSRYGADDFPSRRVYAPAEEAVLGPRRAQVRIVELEGALFFGTAERLEREAELAPADATDCIFDLRRLTAIDASGALALARAGRRLAERGITPRLAGVKPGDRHERVLRSHGVGLVVDDGGRAASAIDGSARLPTPGVLRLGADIDRAVEAAERDALARAGAPGDRDRIAVAQCRLFEGLTPAQFDRLAPELRERRLHAGERLFAQGEPGRALYLVTEGSIRIADAVTGQRFATLGPGMCFGETAMLDGAARTADAMADVESVVHAWSLDAYEALQSDDPPAAARINRNLARHLSERLRAASLGWRRVAG